MVEPVTAWPNMLNIVRFGPYRPHGFVPGDASPLLSLTPQNAFGRVTQRNLALPPNIVRFGSHRPARVCPCRSEPNQGA